MRCATACSSSATHQDSTRRLRMTSRVGTIIWQIEIRIVPPRPLIKQARKKLVLAVGQDARRSCCVSSLCVFWPTLKCHVGAEGPYCTLYQGVGARWRFRSQAASSAASWPSRHSVVTERGVKRPLTWQHSRPVPVACFLEW